MQHNWFRPQAITGKISPHDDLLPIDASDWDIERRHDLATTAKHRAIVQRFSEGRQWEDTDLFRDVYRRRIASGDQVRGAATMEILAAQYYDRIDALHADMKRRGFIVSAGPLPVILIGRNGEHFIGNQGNHRLAIAQLLCLDKIAGTVICRHPIEQAGGGKGYPPAHARWTPAPTYKTINRNIRRWGA